MPRLTVSAGLRLVLFLGLAAFYIVGATEHARRVNTSKARADQSGYLWDGQNVRHNWNGRQPAILIGERNRMPVYAGFLALFWDPATTNEEYFEQAKIWNIYLSLALLGVLAVVLPMYLPPLAATNLTLLVAFGYFIFRAGYVQSELLFYFLYFIAFLLLLDLFVKQSDWRATLFRAAGAGAFAGIAHLTKASVPPLLALFLAIFVVDAMRVWRRNRAAALRRCAAAVVVAAAFLAVVGPYILTNKRVFGRYFYNVNTTFYIWYDDWPQASIGTIKHGDGVGWPTMPPEQLPSASRYWREHTVGQIGARIGAGLGDIVERSWKTFAYFKYLVLYLLAAGVVALRERQAFRDLLRRHSGLAVFLATYAVVYTISIAFYEPVSGTGTTRFFSAHLLPLFFVLTLFLSRRPFARPSFHLLVAGLLAFDIVFLIWPRLMTTYGGF